MLKSHFCMWCLLELSVTMSITLIKCPIAIYSTFLSGLVGSPVFCCRFSSNLKKHCAAHLLLYILHMQMSMNKVLLFCGGGGIDIHSYGNMKKEDLKVKVSVFFSHFCFVLITNKLK